MPLKEYTPKIGDAIARDGGGGGGAGMGWAQRKAQLMIRQKALQQHQSQLEQQMTFHKMAILEKMAPALNQLAFDQDPKTRAQKFKVFEAQASAMGVDISSWKPMVQDQNFFIDLGSKLSSYMTAVKNSDLKTASQSLSSVGAILGDPLLVRQQIDRMTQGINAQKIAGVKNDQSQQRQGAKDITSAIKDAQAGYNRDVKKINDSFGDVETARGVIDKALTEGASYNAASVSITRMLNGGGRLPIAEINKFDQGDRALYQRLLQAGDKGLEGTMTQNNHDQLMHIVDVFERSQKDKYGNVANQYAGELHQRAGIPFEDAYTKITNKPYDGPGASSSKEAAGALSSDQVKMIKDRLGDLRKSGLNDDQIHDAIEKDSGLKLTDKDFSSLGLKVSAPKAEGETPSPGKVQADQILNSPSPSDQENANPPADESTPIPSEIPAPNVEDEDKEGNQ